MKIGARVLKTGLAITLSIYVSLLIIPDHSAVMAAIAAVTTTAPTVKKSFEMFHRRVLANIIGGVVAVGMSLTIGNSPIAIGIAAILLLTILNAAKLNDVLTLAVITLAAIMSSENPNFIDSAIYRVLETIIGVTVSFIVNLVIYPPHYEDKFVTCAEELTAHVNAMIRATLRKNMSFAILEKDLDVINKSYEEMKLYYSLIHEELVISKKERIAVAKRLVVFRKMLKTTEAMIDLLVILHRHDHVFKTFPLPLRKMIRERVELLMDGHEQILMKYNGKIDANNVNFMQVSTDYRKQYIRKFYQQAQVELERDDEIYEAEVNGVVHIMSAIYTYEEQLFALNKIITIYRQRYDQEAK